jgi:hypothetical protein
MTSKPGSALILALLMALAAGMAACESYIVLDRDTCAASPGQLYTQRIQPLLTTDRPASCSACHASGVELADFVRGTECEAMACLQEQGLVRLDAPEESVLLSWIGRVPPDSSLIDASVVKEERAAFLEWFQHEAACQSCAGTACPDPEPTGCAADDRPENTYDAATDPGDCSDETLERLFRGTVFTWRARCAPCHIEGLKSAAATARFFFQDGDCGVASLASLNRMVALGLIDVDDPMRSLLLLKPLAESNGGVPHGGHDKITAENDRAFDGYSLFLNRYGTCKAP